MKSKLNSCTVSGISLPFSVVVRSSASMVRAPTVSLLLLATPARRSRAWMRSSSSSSSRTVSAKSKPSTPGIMMSERMRAKRVSYIAS